jgi:hypothetical protein
MAFDFLNTSKLAYKILTIHKLIFQLHKLKYKKYLKFFL